MARGGALRLGRSLAAAMVVVALAGAAAGMRPVVSGRASCALDDWPMLRHDPLHQGVSCETTLGASNAPSLKLDWSVNTGASSFSSPAVVYNATLGKSIVYVGNQGGQMNAYDAATGALVWSFQVPKTAGLSKEIETSPAVFDDVVYFGAGDYHEYAVNATTGALVCTSPSAGGIIAGSAVVGNPDGVAGHDVVYYGDSGPSGTASDGGHQWAMWAATDSGPGVTPCATRWSAGPFYGNSGVYATQAYGTLKDNITRVVVFGTTDPDDAVYELNAATGAQLWKFQTKQGIDSDVGAPPTISAPGVNGFADGVVYETGKDGITYAIDLQTGAQIWAFDFRANGFPGNPAQSGASLVGDTIYLGFPNGALALNASTGALVWTSSPVSAASISMPSISGATGDQVIFRGDMAGVFHADSLTTGQSLFTYPTGGSGVYMFSSPAVSTGRVFIANSAGILFAFGLTAHAPSVSSVSPNAGPASGGTAVTVSGSQFQAGATVTFGPTAATNVQFLSSSTLLATTPAGSGTVNVTVTNPDGTSATLPGGFTYVPGFTCDSSTGSASGQPTVLGGRPYTGGSDAVGVAQGATNAYFAEGYTGPGFQEYLTVQNPGAAQTLCVDYLLQTGKVIVKPYSLAGSSRTTIDVNGDVGGGQNVSAHLYAQNPFIAERPMYFDYNNSITGGDDVMGAQSLNTTFYFAEGYTGPGFSEYLTLMNPSSQTAVVNVTYFFQSGSPKVVQHSIAPTSRATIFVNDPAEAGPNQSVSTLVQSTGVAILAERPMYFDYNGKWTGGHVAVGATALSQSLNLAEGHVGDGFDEYLTLFNPGIADATATITYYLRSGAPVARTVAVPAQTRQTVFVNGVLPAGSDDSVKVTSDAPIMVERPMYFDYLNQWTGGHDAVAVSSSQLASTLHFAEGYVASNFTEYLTVENPNNAAVGVTFDYQVQGGGTKSVFKVVQPNSRFTELVNADLASGSSSSVTVSASGGNILVERPMYFAY